MMWSPGLHHLKELDNQVLKKVLSPPCGGLSGARYQSGIYTLALLFVLNTREVAKELQANSARLKQVVLVYSLPVAGQYYLT